MIKSKIPVLSTIIVTLAVATMIALGVWQIARLQEKEAQLAQLAANFDAPAVTFPTLGPADQSLLFRKSSVTCLSVVDWTVDAGKADNGVTGFRYIAHCATGAEGPGARVVIGVGNRPDLKPNWSGGTVAGWISFDRGGANLLTKLMGQDAPTTALLVANEGLAGLKGAAMPTVDSVPNNHLAYAVQWFLFAFIAAGIYAILLWQRAKGKRSAKYDA